MPVVVDVVLPPGVDRDMLTDLAACVRHESMPVGEAGVCLMLNAHEGESFQVVVRVDTDFGPIQAAVQNVAASTDDGEPDHWPPQLEERISDLAVVDSTQISDSSG